MDNTPIHHLMDAALTAILLIAVLAGVPLWIIFSIYLALGVFTGIARAFSAWVKPLTEAIRTSPSSFNDAVRQFVAGPH